MAPVIPFITEFEFAYDEPERVSPRIRRLVAQNPTAFTYKGTGTFIIGHGEVAIIDPGPLQQEHVDAILRAVEGETVKAILVTHTHKDHSPAAQPLKEATGAPTYGGGRHGANLEGGEHSTSEGGDFDFTPDVHLSDGQQVTGPDWTITALHTPGHTSNHFCFALEEEGALFTGDHVMAWSTSVVCPPDGDMGAYLRSLERLRGRGDTVYYPTHGPAIPDPEPFLDRYIAYRRAREDQILEHLLAGRHKIKEIVDAMYADVDKRVHRAAALMVLAHLRHMAEDGRVDVRGGSHSIADLTSEFIPTRQAA
jgi:glyoxylase-like metal-dependent hydrolase (beta-lactamase superfamily II)